MELLSAPEKLFCIHFEIGIKDREPGVRFTFTNMEKEYSVTGGNVHSSLNLRLLKYPSNLKEEIFGQLSVLI